MLTKETILDTIKVHMPYFRESLAYAVLAYLVVMPMDI